MHFCQICIDCLCEHKGFSEDYRDEEVWVFYHHFSLDSLQSSAGHGCVVCSLLLHHSLPNAGRKNPHEPLAPGIPLTAIMLFPNGSKSSTSNAPQDATRLIAIINSESTFLDLGTGENLAYFFLIPKDSSNLHQIKFSSENASTTESQECWSLALAWLEDCTMHHSDCHVPDQPTWYPTRLLRISQSTNMKDYVHLVVSAREKLSGGYITLSHRWGNSVNIKLTRQNLSELRGGIQVSHLPLTFQHAVNVAKRLGKSYIWIDSMCISQDDDKLDWLIEAGLMDKVYANGFLNVAATGSMYGSEGLFQNRNPLLELELPELSIPVTLTANGKPGTPRRFLFHDFLFFQRELMGAPLNQRGWVLQERLLSRRVLHFGSRQLFWECRNGLHCERYPSRDGLPSFMSQQLYAAFKSSDIAHVRPHAKNIGKELIWSTIIQAYSLTDLSFPSDKVVAISGIAKYMIPVMGDDYIAGMWRRRLESQLAWSIHEDGRNARRPSTRAFAYRAPTWSWLSVDGEVTDALPYEFTHFKIVDISMTYATEDKTGTILDGSLRIQGLLRSLRIAKYTTKHREGHTIELEGMYTLTIGGRRLGKPLEEQEPGVSENVGMIVHLDVPTEQDQFFAVKDELFVMSVGGPRTALADEQNPGSFIPAHHMLLLRCVDKLKGVFHRFGEAYHFTDKRPDIWALLQEPALDSPETFPCIEFDVQKQLHTFLLE